MPTDPQCPHHSGLSARTVRNEQDIQTLFDKLGEAIGILHRVDKRLEGLMGKIAGIAAATTLAMSIILKLIPWDRILSP